MAEKLNRETLGLKTVQDVYDIMDQLTPWERESLKMDFYFDKIAGLSESDVLREFDIDPIDHVDFHDVQKEFEDEIINDAEPWKLLDALEDQFKLRRVKPEALIELLECKLEDSYCDFTENDIEDLDKLITGIKEKKEKRNNQ